MVRRTSLIMVAFMVVVLVLMPRPFPHSHMATRTTTTSACRDWIGSTCDQKIGIKAELTTDRGDAVKGLNVHFEISNGARHDTVAPANVVTDRRGEAVTYVRLTAARTGTRSWHQSRARRQRGSP